MAILGYLDNGFQYIKYKDKVYKLNPNLPDLYLANGELNPKVLCCSNCIGSCGNLNRISVVNLNGVPTGTGCIGNLYHFIPRDIDKKQFTLLVRRHADAATVYTITYDEPILRIVERGNTRFQWFIVKKDNLHQFLQKYIAGHGTSIPHDIEPEDLHLKIGKNRLEVGNAATYEEYVANQKPMFAEQFKECKQKIIKFKTLSFEEKKEKLDSLFASIFPTYKTYEGIDDFLYINYNNVNFDTIYEMMVKND